MIVAEQVKQPMAKKEIDLFACEGAVSLAATERRFKRDHDIAQDGTFRTVLLKRKDVRGSFLVPILAI
jgi:hypothetical protein